MLAAAALLGWVLAVEPVVVSAPEQKATEILQDDRYAFCHDEAYPLTELEAQWCPLVREADSACPALAKACRAPRGRLSGPPGRLARRTVDDAPSESRHVPTPPRRRAEPADDAIALPSLGGLGEVLFWLVLVLAAGALGIALARNFGPRRRREAEPATASEPGPSPEAEDAPDAPDGPVETDVERLLRLARDAAAREAWPEAIAHSHIALLRRLDRDGEIHLLRSRTSGDYLRQLRRRPGLHGPVRDVLRDIDRAHFGEGSPRREVFESIFSRVVALTRRGVITSVLLWIAIASGLGCEGAEGSTDLRWSSSPSGVDATIEMLRSFDVDAGYLETPLAERAEPPAVVVLLPGAELTPADWDAVASMVRRGGRLVLTEDVSPPSWLLSVSYGYASAEHGGTRVWPTADSPWDPALVLTLPEGPSLRADSGTPWLVRGASSQAIAWERDYGTIVALADERLLVNASLAMPGHAEAVFVLLAYDNGEVLFVDDWLGHGADGPGESIRHSHLTPALLQLLVLMGLLFAWRGTRFGRPRPLPTASRRAFSRHARAMAQHYARARAVGHATGLYARWALERLRERAPTSARGGLSGLAHALARETGRDETEIMRLLVEAHDAAERGVVDHEDEGLRIMRALMQLLHEEDER